MECALALCFDSFGIHAGLFGSLAFGFQAGGVRLFLLEFTLELVDLVLGEREIVASIENVGAGL